MGVNGFLVGDLHAHRALQFHAPLQGSEEYQ
jgi:hypothetical protein